jgi:hypothetical protein
LEALVIGVGAWTVLRSKIPLELRAKNVVEPPVFAVFYAAEEL